MKPGDVDLDEAVALLPVPLFRHRDIYDVAGRLGLHPSDGQTLWWILKREGRIRKTTTPVGKGFYWERASCDGHSTIETTRTTTSAMLCDRRTSR